MHKVEIQLHVLVFEVWIRGVGRYGMNTVTVAFHISLQSHRRDLCIPNFGL